MLSKLQMSTSPYFEPSSPSSPSVTSTPIRHKYTISSPCGRPHDRPSVVGVRAGPSYAVRAPGTTLLYHDARFTRPQLTLPLPTIAVVIYPPALWRSPPVMPTPFLKLCSLRLSRCYIPYHTHTHTRHPAIIIGWIIAHCSS